MTNRLAKEASPYLQQHAHNPVDWYPWGQEALSRAKAEDRPILLSIGYSACHWCHVMERESFEDERIAALMNQSFVNVKVDREERPDLDQIYQLVVQLLGRSGGWPLTVFLTPEQKPFFAGTYFPPEDRHGLPGFPRILAAVAEAYRERRSDVDLQAREVADAITQVSRPPSDKPGAIDRGALAKAADRLSTRFDDEHGGFGSRPKFPSTMSLDVLLHHGALNGDERALGRFRRALDGMRDGGVYDQLGGGFHRYSTDERWLVPHFEKMLYDNALLLRLYVDGFRQLGEARFADTAREIVGWLFREMKDAQGGFYSTQDADSEGEEGKFFVWTPDQVREAAGADAELVMRRFGVTDEGNFEDTGASVLYLARSIEQLAVAFSTAPSEIEKRLERARASMLAYRERRPKPFRDDKILASWNGLVIGALADASRALAEPSWLAAAERAFGFLWDVLADQRGGEVRMLRHCKDGVAKGPGFLDDQAFVGCAALDLYEATGDEKYVEAARALADGIRAHFADAEGRLFLVADDGESLIARAQDVYDHAVPSATSMALQLLLRLGAMVGGVYAAFAEAELGRLAPSALENPFGLSQIVLLVDRVARGSTDVVLAGERMAESELLAATFSRYVPHRTIAFVGSGGRSAAPVLAEGKVPPASPAALAWVCHGRTCSLPLSETSALLRELSPARDTP